MNDPIISIRMPSGMVEEVKRLSAERHFLDMSEALRSIIRNKWIKSAGISLKYINGVENRRR